MKTIVIFTLFFITVNSSFLRQLATSINEVSFTSSCAVHPSTTAVTMTLKVGTAVETTGTFKSVISAGEDATIESTCTLDTTTDSTKKTFTCSVDPSNKAAGVYFLKSLTETAATTTDPSTPGQGTTNPDNTNQNNTNTNNTEPARALAEATDVTTFEVGDGATGAFTIAETIELATEQEKAPTVDAKDSSKNTFKIVLAAKATAAPAVFVSEDAKTPLTGCTLGEDKVTVTCKPTADEMKNEEEYKIHYYKGCTKTDTGIVVTFKNASAFIIMSKLAVFVLALLF